MNQKLISNEVERIVTLKNYYKGLRLVELRLVYRSMVTKAIDNATLNRMVKEDLVNEIVKRILKPLDN